jgi:hypothetical protein
MSEQTTNAIVFAIKSVSLPEIPAFFRCFQSIVYFAWLTGKDELKSSFIGFSGLNNSFNETLNFKKQTYAMNVQLFIVITYNSCFRVCILE